MTNITLLNDGNPLPTGHPRAGQYALSIERDGAGPQRVYAESPTALTLKLASMYGTTQDRIAEVKEAERQAREQAAGATARPQAPHAPATPVVAAEDVMQATQDLSNPERATSAVKTLLRAGGVDVDAEANTRRASEATAELERKNREAVDEFVRRNPDFVPGPAGRLIRDRAFASAGSITVDSLQDAFDSLKEEGLLDSEPLEPATPPQSEPSASQATRPRGTATSVRPGQLGARGRQAPTPKMTYSQVLKMSETPEYEERLRNEPGFAESVNEAVAAFEKRAG